MKVNIQRDQWFQRVKGLVVNAFCCSHAELDKAIELDFGNPTELTSQLVDIVAKYPHIKVVGGCRGTDLEHLKKLAERISRVDS